jgi:wyosine [tRNA(Phe)-imidazoG37] synthetase (radical SAM superfamily)
MNKELVLQQIEYLAQYGPIEAIALSRYMHSDKMRWTEHTVLYDEQLHEAILDLVQLCKSQITPDSYIASHPVSNYKHACILCELTTGFNPQKREYEKSASRQNKLRQQREWIQKRDAKLKQLKAWREGLK